MKTNKIIYALFVGVLLLTGCEDKFLDLKPTDFESEIVYFDKLSDFEYAANNLHPNVYAFNGNTTYPINHDWGTDIVSAGNGEVDGTNAAGTGDQYWDTPYKWLRTINQVIEKGEAYSKPDEIAGPIGQAYFFRAWQHFFLLKRFGGVPIAIKVTQLNDETVLGKRNSRYEVIKQIVDDLDVAIAKLAKTTVTSTGNDGHVTLEAAKAFKARVCLYAGTWDKYVGTKTDGDGTSSGAGSTKPSGYPSVSDFLTMAKNLSKEIIDGKQFAIWMGVEDVSSKSSVKNPEMYAHNSYYYLFNLEGATSNPAGLTKASNKEAIYRSVYDAVNRKTATNLTHTWPASMTQKLADMYLCTDGLPVHISPLFKGYTDMNAERENRDYRYLAMMGTPTLGYSWGWGMYGTGAQYDVDITTLSKASYLNVPNYRTYSGASAGGRKFRSELASVKTAGDEGMDFMHIRLPEVYLIYAEATCELGNGSISDADLDYSVNKVRARGGVAPLNSAHVAKATGLGVQLTMLGEIRRERAIELYGEGQRLADLCRWGIAVEELAGQPKCGGYLVYNGVDSYIKTLINPLDNKPVYTESAFATHILAKDVVYSYPGFAPTKVGAVIADEATNRKFSLKNYLQPIPTDQIKLNPELKQNPSW